MSGQESAATVQTATETPASVGYQPEQNITEILRAAKAEAGIADDDDEQSSPTPAATDEKSAKPPAVETAAPDVRELQKLAKDGKFEDVLKKLGIDPEGTKIPSHRFAEFRVQQREAKAKIAAEQKRVADRELEVRRLVDETVKAHEPFANARKLYDNGDTLGAMKAAFGDDFDKVVERALQQQAGKDPELLALKRREELREKSTREEREATEKRLAVENHAKAEAAYVSRLGSELSEVEDPVIVAAAADPEFVTAVYRAQLHKYDGGKGEELTPLEAAEEVIETIRKAHLKWSDVFGSANGGSVANTAKAGKQPLITDSAGRTPEKKGARKGIPQSKAAVIPQKSVEEMSEAEALRHFASLMDHD